MRPEDELQSAFDVLMRRLREWRQEAPGRRAVPEPRVEELRERLARYTFRDARPLAAMVDDLADLLERWTVHTTHPRYFGLFNANVHDASIVADALAAGYNPQVGLWSHAPAANEIERWVLAYFTRAFGLDPERSAAHFTTGGSEANFSAIAAALTRAFPDLRTRGVRGLPGLPVFYVSQEAHHSVEKSAHLLGLGREAVRWVPTDDQFRMDPQGLEQAIHKDRAAGHLPFLVLGTAGTTTLGSVDPLEALGDVARRENLWYHVDAAWGGGAILSPRLRTHLRGIEAADSITCDAHKWLSVSMGAGMLFCRHPQALVNAFNVETPYVTGSIRDLLEPFSTTLQWSRRFIGLKLFMTLGHLGEAGVVKAIEHQADMGSYLEQRLGHAGWRVLTHSPFPLVCFTHPRIQDGGTTVRDILDRVYDRGRLWISEAIVPQAGPALRACICNYRTRKEDVDILVEEVESALSGPGSESGTPRA